MYISIATTYLRSFRIYNFTGRSKFIRGPVLATQQILSHINFGSKTNSKRSNFESFTQTTVELKILISYRFVNSGYWSVTSCVVFYKPTSCHNYIITTLPTISGFLMFLLDPICWLFHLFYHLAMNSYCYSFCQQSIFMKHYSLCYSQN